MPLFYGTWLALHKPPGAADKKAPIGRKKKTIMDQNKANFNTNSENKITSSLWLTA
jgi:hypothetical protein